MHADKQNAIDFIEAGDIGAAVGFKDIKTGDTLSSEKHPIILESMIFPDPVIGIAVEPKTKADVDKLGIALSKLWQIVSVTENIMLLISAMVIISSFIGMTAILYSTLNGRRKEMALLRIVGASPYTCLLYTSPSPRD